MIKNKNNKKLRTRSDKELSKQMEGLIVLKKVLQSTLDEWFLSGGTLLGAYRDGDFIPWDWDVEVTVLTEEAREKESELLNNLVDAGFLITSLDSSIKNFKIVALGWGTEYEILGRYLRESDASRVRAMTKVPAHLFKKSEMISFRNHKFPAPSPVSQFLESLYGNWKIPLKSVDKKSYFSKDAFLKKKSRLDKKIIIKIGKLICPPEVKEFPAIKGNDIDIFQSWDGELGWCNKPNFTNVDRSDFSDNSKIKQKDGMVVFNTDNNSSRICSNPSMTPDISFYGDGYCMCRNVHDNKTFSWYLGKSRNTRVSNYGVNNYGLDQSLILLKRNYKKDPSKTVVLALSSYTMAYSSSVYGHYLDPKNILAVKPRFQIKNDNGELEYIKYPLGSKQDLIKLSSYKNFFRTQDQHFNFWKQNRLNYFINELPVNFFSLFGFNLKSKPKNKFEYKLSFWKSQEKLFLSLITFFQKLSIDYGFKPVFLLQHDKYSLEYLSGKHYDQLIWSSAINKAKEKFPKIKFLDEAEIFNTYKYKEELYSNLYHSPKANCMIADYLNINL